MKTWIVSSLDEESIQGEETIQGRKLYEEIRYTKLGWFLHKIEKVCIELKRICNEEMWLCPKLDPFLQKKVKVIERCQH